MIKDFKIFHMLNKTRDIQFSFQHQYFGGREEKMKFAG